MGQRQGLNGTRFFSETAALYLFKDTGEKEISFSFRSAVFSFII
jgi:hypothetical protein